MGNRRQFFWSTLDGGSLELRGPFDQNSNRLLGNAAIIPIGVSLLWRRALVLQEWVTTTARRILSLGLDQCHQLCTADAGAPAYIYWVSRQHDSASP